MVDWAETDQQLVERLHTEGRCGVASMYRALRCTRPAGHVGLHGGYYAIRPGSLRPFVWEAGERYAKALAPDELAAAAEGDTHPPEVRGTWEGDDQPFIWPAPLWAWLSHPVRVRISIRDTSKILLKGRRRR